MRRAALYAIESDFLQGRGFHPTNTVMLPRVQVSDLDVHLRTPVANATGAGYSWTRIPTLWKSSRGDSGGGAGGGSNSSGSSPGGDGGGEIPIVAVVAALVAGLGFIEVLRHPAVGLAILAAVALFTLVMTFTRRK